MVVGVVCKPDGRGGLWRLYLHDDDTAELLHRESYGSASRTVMGRVVLYELRGYLAGEGIGEDGWVPD